MAQGKTNRRKGHDHERREAKKFRELGYTFCKTSREASRLLDASKIDLAFIPFNVQIKAGYAKGLNYVTIFNAMLDALKENFPPDDQIHSYPPVIIHNKGRTEEEKLVVMRKKDFYNMIEANNETES